MPMRSRLDVNSIEAAIDVALDGMGLTRVLSYQVADQLRQCALAITLHHFEPPPAPVDLLFNGHSCLPLKLRAFIDFASPRLREGLEKATLQP